MTVPAGRTADEIEHRSSPEASPSPVAWAVGVATVLARRPDLWATAARQVLRLAPPGWRRRRPHLPLPDPGYVAFRLRTAYGDDGRLPDPDDVVAYLRWCRAWPLVAAPTHP